VSEVDFDFDFDFDFDMARLLRCEPAITGSAAMVFYGACPRSIVGKKLSAREYAVKTSRLDHRVLSLRQFRRRERLKPAQP
jgi:hypothetical protein